MVHFDEDSHTYWGDNLNQLISVTTLLKKHGLSTDYSMVNEEVLQRASEKGTAIHKCIERYVKWGEINCNYPEQLATFMLLTDKHKFEWLEAELIVANDIVAGTIDLVGDIDGVNCVVDIKTGQKINKESCRWQLSIYDYLLTGGASEVIGVFHITDDIGKWIPLEKISNEKIEELLDAERNETHLMTSLPPALIESLTVAETILKELDEKKKQVEKDSAEVKAILQQLMEENGLKKFENEVLSITYVNSFEKTTIDSKMLKEGLPQVYKDYSRTSTTKPSVRVTFK